MREKYLCSVYLNPYGYTGLCFSSGVRPLPQIEMHFPARDRPLPLSKFLFNDAIVRKCKAYRYFGKFLPLFQFCRYFFLPKLKGHALFPNQEKSHGIILLDFSLSARVLLTSTRVLFSILNVPCDIRLYQSCISAQNPMS